jgi:general stress protein 26
MSDHLDRAELEIRLWKEIDSARFGMLGLAGGEPRHLQPMTAFTDRDEGLIWFYAKRDNDLIKEGGRGHAAMFCLMAKDQEFQACIGGTLTEDHNREKIRQFWNPVAGAWFPDGKDDPDLTLIRFQPEDAQVWVSHGGGVRFAWEITKANATHKVPDVGDKARLDLR